MTATNKFANFAIIAILLIISQACQTAEETPYSNDNKKIANTREEFYEKYERWLDWKRSYAFRKCSDTSGTTGKYWIDIVSMGIDALPFIIEKVEDDPVMVSAFIQVTAFDPAPSIYYFENNEQKLLGYEKHKEYVLNWWNKDRKTLDVDIKAKIGQFKEKRQKKASKDKLNLILSDIKGKYGVFALPYLIHEIKNGDNDFIPITISLLIFTEKEAKQRENLLEIEGSSESPKVKAAEIMSISEKRKIEFDKIEAFIKDSHDEK